MRISVRITSAKRYKTFVSSDKAWFICYLAVKKMIQLRGVVCEEEGRELKFYCSYTIMCTT